MNGKKWFTVFAGTLFAGLLLYLFNYIYLKANFENNSFKQIVERQIKNKSIYGTALNQNNFKYKLELVRQTKPEIIALGSSRVMQFRSNTFKKSFVTTGGAMNYLNEGALFLEEMYKFHKPKYIILGLDFWWFNDNHLQPAFFPSHDNDGTTINLKKMTKPLRYLVTQKNNPSTLMNIFTNGILTNQYTNFDNLGFAAIKGSDGFRVDGSYFYSRVIFGLMQSNDAQFSSTFRKIKRGRSQFKFGKTLSQKRLAAFNKVLKIIHDNNTKVIIFIPPVANKIHSVLGPEKHNYIFELREHIRKLPLTAFDYHDLSVLTKDDCECVDGFHGGDIVYSRILLDIYNSKKDIEFNKLLNLNVINNNIRRFKGKVLSVNSHNKFAKKETDFLKLGCPK